MELPRQFVANLRAISPTVDGRLHIETTAQNTSCLRMQRIILAG